MAGFHGVLAVSVAVMLCYGDPGRIRYKRSYLVFWGGGRRLSRVLGKYGVPHEHRVYRTSVGGKQYLRSKIIVRDSELITRVKELLADTSRILWHIRRNRRLVREVMGALKRARFWDRFAELVGEHTLRRLLGIKPFILHVYRVFRDKKLVRMLKPNWRFYRLVKHVYGVWGREGLERLMYRYPRAVVNALP